MRLTRLRGACDPKPTCPTLFLTDRQTLIVQGWLVTGSATTALPARAEETVVEVPTSLLWTTSTPAYPGSSAVQLTGRDTALVRGRIIDDAEVLASLSLPEGETAVEVPISLLPEVVASAQ